MSALQLWEGKYGDRYPSQSEADQALCNHIAFYTQDLKQIERIFRSSGLYREKWEREDYRNKTIGKAIAGLTATYNTPARGLSLSDLENRFATKVEWLYEPLVPKGQPWMLAAREGLGKSLTLLQLSKHILESHSSGLVFWLAVEGALSNTVT